MGRGSPLSARSQRECLKTQTSPSDSSEISILIRGKSGFGQTSSFLPWKLICPGVRRHPQWLVTEGVSTADFCKPAGPTGWIRNLVVGFLWEWIHSESTAVSIRSVFKKKKFFKNYQLFFLRRNVGNVCFCIRLKWWNSTLHILWSVLCFDSAVTVRFTFTHTAFSRRLCPKWLTVIHTYIHTLVAAMQGAAQFWGSVSYPRTLAYQGN